MANNGGHLLLTRAEKDELLFIRPTAARFLKRIVGAKEFLHGIERWCLWLVDANLQVLAQIPEIKERVLQVRKYRLASDRKTTMNLANVSSIFGEIRQPLSSYLLIPEASSERPIYIPMAVQMPEVICSNLAKMILNATIYDFGVLTSRMHMAWVDVVAGRIKSDYRYSNRIVYNNYPWPASPTKTRRATVEELAQRVLDARAQFPDSTLVSYITRC